MRPKALRKVIGMNRFRQCLIRLFRQCGLLGGLHVSAIEASSSEGELTRIGLDLFFAAEVERLSNGRGDLVDRITGLLDDRWLLRHGGKCFAR